MSTCADKRSFITCESADKRNYIAMSRLNVALVVILISVGLAMAHAEYQHQCDNPCPATFVAAPVCGRNVNTGNNRTFRTDCVLFCYNKRHSDNQYIAHGTKLKTCTQLGLAEEARDVPLDHVSEFDL